MRQGHWCLNKKPQGWLVNKEMETCQQRKKHISALISFLSVLPHKRQLLHMYFWCPKGHIQAHWSGPGCRKPTLTTTWLRKADDRKMNRNIVRACVSTCEQLYALSYSSEKHSSNVLIIFAAKCIFWSSLSKSFYSHFCANPVLISLTKIRTFPFFFIVHCPGWTFQAPLGAHCSYSFRENDTTGS